MPTPSRDVFLNIPFDRQGERSFLALIAVLVALGLKPRSVLELPSQRSRLDRLVQMIRSCPYSLHDLSRTGLSRSSTFRLPRFNMPFELGLAVAIAMTTGDAHQWWVIDTKPHRLGAALSDLSGFDATIHDGTIRGVYRAVTDIFVTKGRPLEEDEFLFVYRSVRETHRLLGRETFTHYTFQQLVLAATAAAAWLRQ
ncbi:MAG: hypothetical protein JSU08_11235 [Acidobacteria bacterium]|nr:hypothetical protein [Acidobacteriota bacterium]